MRGSQKPAIKPTATEAQTAFRAYSRGRRTKLAKLARTTLVKADQWARGDAVSADVSEGIEAALSTFRAKKK
jgi:hypothetical protein